MLQGKELPVAEGDLTVATGCSFLRSGSPSLAHDVDEAMSTSSRKSTSMGKEGNWWSADLEDENGEAGG